MAFNETARFPEKISFGAVGGPGYKTDIVTTDSGWEQRNSPWEQARHSYDVSHAARDEILFGLLLKHMHAARGRLHGFRFKDWNDYKVEAGEGVIITLAGGAKQLAKAYTAGSMTLNRAISKPINGTVTVTGGGSVDYTTGIITGGSPTAWVGQFDVPARYDTDVMRAEIIDKSLREGLIAGWSSIIITEIRV